MTDDQRAIQLKQLANIVIDAYINRDKRFVPVFIGGGPRKMYLQRPKGDQDHPQLMTHVWYKRSDYEDTRTPGEQKKTNRTTN